MPLEEGRPRISIPWRSEVHLWAVGYTLGSFIFMLWKDLPNCFWRLVRREAKLEAGTLI